MEERRCWLCERPIGSRVEFHHPIPRSRGGRETVPVHPVCHRTLHKSFSNTQLAKFGTDPSALRAEPAIARFIDWISDKHPDFYVPTRRRR